MLFRIGDRRIAFDFLGPADAPVLCMAHALSADSSIWSEQVHALLARDWRVLRIDMRGHGGSDMVAGPWTMSDLADDVVQVLDFLELPQVHFTGVSIGGMIGQTLALEHPDRILSLILSGTSPRAVPGPASMWPDRFAAIEREGSLEAIADDAMRRWFTPTFRARRPRRWKQVRSVIANTPAEAYVAGARAIIAFDVLDRLSAIRVPTIVACGDGDEGTPPEGNRLIANRIPGARYEEIGNARHVPMMEHPETFNQMMINWLAHRR
ncbi:MAG: alpha/beta fold hydrolase [Novosphingobium sp.]|nr:alpha/beta fold hydrolase [Novosphingobium sp.]